MACQEAHIALSTLPTHTAVFTYEVVLGTDSNNFIEIRDGVQGTVLASHNMEDIISCTEFNAFWLSWGNQRISIGQGTEVGEDMLVSVDDITLESVTSLSVATFAGTVGTWRFNFDNPYIPGEGLMFTYRT